MTIVIQVNSKLRAKIEVSSSLSEEEIKQSALEQENVIKYLDNKKPAKVIYIPGCLVNIVVA